MLLYLEIKHEREQRSNRLVGGLPHLDRARTLLRACPGLCAREQEIWKQ
jgi:hypothetical protein